MITVSSVAAAVCDYFGCTLTDLRSQSRQKPLARYRQVACFLSRELTDKSFQQIGQIIGRRDHSTVIHSVQVIENLITRDPELAADIQYLRDELGSAPDVVAARERLAEMERQREQRKREARIARARNYLVYRKQREEMRLLTTYDDMDLISEFVRKHYGRVAA